MSVAVDVQLLSGKKASVEVEADECVESLKRRAQSILATGKGKLLNSSGEALDGAATIRYQRIKVAER